MTEVQQSGAGLYHLFDFKSRVKGTEERAQFPIALSAPQSPVLNFILFLLKSKLGRQ